MRSRTFIGVGFVLVAAALGFTGCQSATHGNDWSESATIPSVDEYYLDCGDFHRTVTTSHPDAQAWFDRGLYLSYGFNHDEAVRCFERAAVTDPNCAMAYWGIAYAKGPNINNTEMEEAASKAAYDAIQRAIGLSATATAVERDLIHALSKRYAMPAPANRRALDEDYADAMRIVHRMHKTDSDVSALFAESMMVLRPWNHWSPEGEPAPETPEIVKTIESGLAREPNHPGLCHFHIHVMEASPDPGQALPAANALRLQETDAGHLVHMPSHIYIQVGLYKDAIVANKKAIEKDKKYLAREGAMNFYTLYRVHNYHFLVYGAMFDGQSELALEASRELVEQVPPELLAEWTDYLDAFMPTPYHVMVRFGMWEDLLEEPRPSDDLPVTLSVWHYARGIALATLGRVDEAEQEQRDFQIAKARVPESSILFNNTSRDILGVAEAMLEGEIEYRKENYDVAFAALREAVQRDDKLNYDEPWGWMQPARHALGALSLEQNLFKEAAAVYKADLKRHPHNGWSLHGLAECYRRMNRDPEAIELESRFDLVWERADVAIKASCFCRVNS